MHQAGIVHRDIKPENLILRGSELVLIDFDVSRISNPSHNSDTRIMGTTGYAAPEQYGFSQTDARADLYAAGVTFNEMLIGQHPSRALAAGPFRPVIERCIEVNVDKRYQTAAELRAAVLRRLHYRKRRRLWLTVAGVSAAAILALGIFAASRPRPVQGETAPSVEAAALPEVPEAGTQAAAVTPGGTEPPASEPIRTQLPLSEDTAPAVNQGFTTAFTYDLDGDGTVEIPTQPDEAGLLNMSQSRRMDFIVWMDYTRPDPEKSFGLLDEETNCYIELPAEWEGNLMLTDSADIDDAVELRTVDENKLVLTLRLVPSSASAAGWTRLGVVASRQMQAKLGGDAVIQDQTYRLSRSLYRLN